MEETRQYITNRAHEEISHERHDSVYDQLNDFLDCPNDSVNFDAKNWAEAWLMIVELQGVLDNQKI